LPGSGAGPSPDALAIGSEGTLGIITEGWIRVHQPPTERSSGTFRFKSFDDGVAASKALAQSRLFPANCRLLDSREAMINQVVFDGSHVLIVGFESAGEPTKPDMERAAEICREHGGECTDGLKHRSSGKKAGNSGAAGSWKQAFFDGPYRQNILMSLGAIADTFETACTWKAFPEMHRDIVETVEKTLEEVCGSGTITCRFTHVYPDGPAPYYTFIGKATPGEEQEQWQAIKNAASDVLNKHKATITHHHAVGRNHRRWYDKERPELFAKSLRATKSLFDPDWRLNPGVLIDKE
jgi:alkyldihydroxyacetonephosphate synthase